MLLQMYREKKKRFWESLLEYNRYCILNKGIILYHRCQNVKPRS